MYSLDDYGPPSEGILDRLKNWMDAKIHGGYKSAFKGLLQVAASGFGKGVIGIALLTTVGAIIFGATVAPEITPTVELAKLVSNGIISAANFLISPTGLAVLGAGGTFGAISAAHGENKRLNKSQAEEMAKYYEAVREKNTLVLEKAPEKMTDMDIAQNECRAGHCEKLMHEREKQQQVAR